LSLPHDIRNSLEEIRREAQNPARQMEYGLSLQRLVPLAQEALTMIEKLTDERAANTETQSKWWWKK